MACENLKLTIEKLNKGVQNIKIWTPSEIDAYIDRLEALGLPGVVKKTRVYDDSRNFTIKEVEFLNVAAAFDIESTSAVIDGKKAGIMYVWQMAICGELIMGRSWADFVDIIDRLTDRLSLSEDRRLVLYVHNLAFEFQFIKKLFDWSAVFAIDERKPIYAVTGGIEFRCSYLLSGYPLAKLHESLHNYKCRKAVGDLDYSKIRHAGTPLSDKEIFYCVLDVVVVSAYIDEQIDAEGAIFKIPMTKTGYVRRYCREKTVDMTGKKGKELRGAMRYKEVIRHLNLTLADYQLAKAAYAGGFTHANGWKSGKMYFNVASQDFTSSYPAVMVGEKFPMSEPVDITSKIHSVADLEAEMQKNAVVVDVGFVNLESSTIQERIISASKCFDSVNVVRDNGRVVSADRVRLVITEVDYFSIKKFYTWAGIKVFKAVAMRRAYLPTAFVKAVLELYRGKTELKGVAGREFEYGLKKEMVNSTYGMTVTAIIRDLIAFDETAAEWADTVKSDARPLEECEQIINEYNGNRGRFLYYYWGVYITAYARRNLFTAILELGTDYIYSDTDSVKYLNHSAHADYFERYNKLVTKKMEIAMQAHGLPLDYWKPKTIKGKEKPLGFWDREADMLIFKTLGAKRYLYMTEDRELHLTVAGVSKSAACEYLERTYGKYGAFYAFAENLTIPPQATGKLTHYYIDEKTGGVVTDYLGNALVCESESGIYLEPAEYNLSIAPEYRAMGEFFEEFFKIREDR